MIDSPTVGERYSSATESSNLRLRLDRRGDVDALIAAGWVREDLGTALHRLRSEFDGIKAEQERIDPLRTERLTALESAWLRLLNDGPPPGAFLYEYELRRREIDASRVTSLLLCRSELKSLGEAVWRVGASAWRLADRMRLRNSIDVERLASRALDVFLDPTCRGCDGRGFNGGAHRGEKAILCKPCRGSGNRRDEIGKNDTERNFALNLLMQLGSELAEVDRRMRGFLR